MRIYDLITKKKHGLELEADEIRELIKEYTDGKIPDYQMSALLMAICLQGMTDEETWVLTDAIAHSGEVIDLSEFGSLAVDKHSTGGVGDKTTLVVAPIAAVLGCKVAKMSGRGLGHTGGTVDKLESFSGYNTSLDTEQFFKNVREVGIAVTGQSGNLAPADKRLYALRDVTATVDSIPLITSSVMGKKIASGAGTIVLDVKYGSGSFMKTAEEAEALAEKMVTIGKRLGRRTTALITNMDEPLGYAVGNILEVKEAIATLQAQGPSDLTQVCVELGAAMAASALDIPIEEARKRAEDAIKSGEAYYKFIEWVGAQGADTTPAVFPEQFPTASVCHQVVAERDGYICRIDAEKIGLASVALGAGRESKGDSIDHTAGIILNKKIGDPVARGEVVMTLYTSEEARLATAEEELSCAVVIGEQPPKKGKLIHKIIV